MYVSMSSAAQPRLPLRRKLRLRLLAMVSRRRRLCRPESMLIVTSSISWSRVTSVDSLLLLLGSHLRIRMRGIRRSGRGSRRCGWGVMFALAYRQSGVESVGRKYEMGVFSSRKLQQFDYPAHFLSLKLRLPIQE